MDSSRGAAGFWLTLELPFLASLAACAREDARSERPLSALTPAQGRAMRAFGARIIPSDDGTPGAEEAGAVHFVDRAIGRPPFAASAAVIRLGLENLDARASSLGRQMDFATLPAAQQIALMREIEREPFFRMARLLVVLGTFADPQYGGNLGSVGWAMLGIDHRPTYAAPFGWYDAQEVSTSAEAAR